MGDEGREDTAGYLHPATLLLAGLLWGIHPLRVESVAWVTERKDVLNGLFSLGTLLCYLRFAELKDLEGRTREAAWSCIFSLVLLLFSLMSKPVSVVIPVMLLVLDWYPLNRFRKGNISSILLEKLPFLILVASVSLATIHFAAGNQILVSYHDFPLIDRILLAGNSLYEYCRLSLYPVDIIHIYLLPRSFPLSYTLKTVVVLIFSCVCIGKIKKMPWLFAAWILFVLPLLPVLGFFQNGAQSHAARFTYLPAVMPSICAAALGFAACRTRSAAISPRHAGAMFLCLGMLVLLVYAATTERLIGSWKNSEALWSRVIAIQPIGRAYYLRADYYLQKGRYPEAAEDLRTSIDMGEKAGFPEVFNLHALRGDALGKAGRYQEAVQEFSAAISLYPHPRYYFHRGMALKALGRMEESEPDLMRAGKETGPIEWLKK
jgi:tetratricopeptide (TPR) repeat protein